MTCLYLYLFVSHTLICTFCFLVIFPSLKARITEDVSHLSSILCNLSTVQNITSRTHSSECSHLQFLVVCVCVRASVCGVYLVSTAIKGERKGFWRKGSCVFLQSSPPVSKQELLSWVEDRLRFALWNWISASPGPFDFVAEGKASYHHALPSQLLP